MKTAPVTKTKKATTKKAGHPKQKASSVGSDSSDDSVASNEKKRKPVKITRQKQKSAVTAAVPRKKGYSKPKVTTVNSDSDASSQSSFASDNKSPRSKKQACGDSQDSNNVVSVDAQPPVFLTPTQQNNYVPMASVPMASVPRFPTNNSSVTGASIVSPAAEQGSGTLNLQPGSTIEGSNTVDLTSFGLTPATNPNSQFGNTTVNKVHFLRAAIVGGDNNDFTVAFRCEPADVNTYNSPWCAKVFFDAVREVGGWASKLNLSPNVANWYHLNQEQKTRSNYNIRLFLLPLQVLPPHQRLLDVAQYICNKINAVPDNRTVLKVNPANFFWLPGIVTWPDIIGQEAYSQMIVTAPAT